MSEEVIQRITGSCKSKNEQGKYYRILRGVEGKFGPEINIDLDELKAAIEARDVYTFESKKTGHKFLPVSVKVWPKKDEPQSEHNAAKANAYQPQNLNDEIPF